MKKYTFFSYEVSEALHLSESEQHIVMDCLRIIRMELEHGVDKHSRRLIATHIELLLGYCMQKCILLHIFPQRRTLQQIGMKNYPVHIRLHPIHCTGGFRRLTGSKTNNRPLLIIIIGVMGMYGYSPIFVTVTAKWKVYE